MSADSKKRSCHVIKAEDEQFEFNLQQSDEGRGQLISSVTAEGPADRAGLKEGDRIVTVNGVNVEKKTHAEVVNLIKECIATNEIKFEVLDEEDAPSSPSASKTSQKENTNVETSASSPEDLRPRICTIVNTGETMGFKYEMRKGSDKKPIHFVQDVYEGGPGAHSGLRKGDRIIAVGSTNVEKMSQAKVASLMKKKGKKITLLVVDESTYKHFKAKKMKIKASLARKGSEAGSSPAHSVSKPSTSSISKNVSSKSSDDVKARLVHVIKKADIGYGFSLHVKHEEKGEFLGQLVTGKPGSRCGLMQDDLVIAVNGQLVLGKSHDDVTGLIKSHPNHVVLLVTGPAAIENLKRDGFETTLRDITKQLWEKPKSFKLQKEANGFGFSLETEPGSQKNIIDNVEDGSPAKEQGLENGDVLACVNGDSVIHLDHNECVKKIKKSGNAVELIVGSAETMKLFHDLQINISPKMLHEWPEEKLFAIPDVTEDDHHYLTDLTVSSVKKEIKTKANEEDVEPKPRLCKLKMTSGGFGFFLKDDDSHLLVNITKEGAAAVAGIQENDRIIEVNKVNVEKMNHEKVVKLIKKSGKKVTFLVCLQKETPLEEDAPSAAADDSSKKKEIPRPRFCELVKENNTFGFFLIEDNDENPNQFIRDVLEGGAGAKAGLLNGDRVIEVNGENIKDKTHDDVVELIKASGDQVNFLVVDTECDLFYKEKKMEITKALITTDIQDDSALITADIQDDSALDKSEADSVKIEAEDRNSEGENEDVSELIKDAISESRAQEDREETGEELKDDTKDDVASGGEEDLEAAGTESDASESLKEGTKDNIDAAKDATLEKMKEEVVDEIKDDFEDEIKNASVEEMKEEFVEDTKEAVLEQIKEEVHESIMESIEDEVKEEIVRETREEAEERIKREMKEKIELEMRQKMEEEIKRKVEEEMRKEMAKTMRPNIVETSSIPEPPKFIGSVSTANAVSNQKVSRVSVKKNAQAFAASSPPPVKQENLFNAISSLRKVQRPNGATGPCVNEANEKPAEAKEDTVKPNYLSARAMFENRSKPQQSNQRPNWQRNQGASVKKFSSSYGRS